MSKIYSRELPPDFDVETYLALNPDVHAAGVDPVDHFLTHGQNENRSFALTNDQSVSPVLQSDQRKTCLTNLDVNIGQGLEIGPLDRPLLAASEGRIFYADHFSTDALRQKYAKDPIVVQDNICPVHFDLSKIKLSEALPPGVKYDYVVASHVIEHVPDLIGWLRDIESLLKTGGSLALAIPDKRFTFDVFRRETAFWMVEEAVGRNRPDMDTVLDYLCNVVSADCSTLWSDYSARQDLRKIHSARHCSDMIARYTQGEYVDVHCWVFTPYSFLELIQVIIERARLKFEVSFFLTTRPYQLEFYVQLKRL